MNPAGYDGRLVSATFVHGRLDLERNPGADRRPV